MIDTDTKINVLINGLKRLGEDKDELEYWRSITGDLDFSQKTELLAILEGEFKALAKKSV